MRIILKIFLAITFPIWMIPGLMWFAAEMIMEAMDW
jgi:hypothetical protein